MKTRNVGPYAGGTFKLNLRFPADYPRSAPEFTFTTPIFHPNVSSQGEIRLAELEPEGWSPAWTVWSLLISLQATLSGPNTQVGCGLNEEAEKLYLEDMKVFEDRARQWTLSHAM
jgi:ubiquitin-conjugating enzyme E2 D/E